MIEKDFLNNLCFSFITADNIEFLKPYLEELKKQLNNNSIILGPQFSSNSILINGIETPIKINSKIDHISNLLIKADIKTIFYADDDEMNYRIVEGIITRHYPEIELINFIPGSNIETETVFSNKDKGLKSLNKCIEEYLNQKKTRFINKLWLYYK